MSNIFFKNNIQKYFINKYIRLLKNFRIQFFVCLLKLKKMISNLLLCLILLLKYHDINSANVVENI